MGGGFKIIPEAILICSHSIKIHMKCQGLFSLKNKKIEKMTMLSAVVVIGVGWLQSPVTKYFFL